MIIKQCRRKGILGLKNCPQISFLQTNLNNTKIISSNFFYYCVIPFSEATLYILYAGTHNSFTCYIFLPALYQTLTSHWLPSSATHCYKQNKVQ